MFAFLRRAFRELEYEKNEDDDTQIDFSKQEDLNVKPQGSVESKHMHETERELEEEKQGYKHN